MDYRMDVLIFVAEPLDNVAYITILFSYLHPVDYEVKCFRRYYTEDEWYDIPFQPATSAICICIADTFFCRVAKWRLNPCDV